MEGGTFAPRKALKSGSPSSALSSLITSEKSVQAKKKAMPNTGRPVRHGSVGSLPVREIVSLNVAPFNPLKRRGVS
jgi:hypothetical protein